MDINFFKMAFWDVQEREEYFLRNSINGFVGHLMGS
jgi:hypothetical protein